MLESEKGSLLVLVMGLLLDEKCFFLLVQMKVVLTEVVLVHLLHKKVQMLE